MSIKSFITAGVIAAIATTSTGSAARAASDSEKLAAFLLGAGVLAVIAKKSRDDKQAAPVYRHNHTATPHRYPATPRYTHQRPQKPGYYHPGNRPGCEYHVHGRNSRHVKNFGHKHDCRKGVEHGFRKAHGHKH
ncbi:hypothetical protein BFP76_08765 [Amylibacter kogurei]|uniref:Uncharacterized protein n=1 Tax=Paramylibacter kogurei TaxID=1889778 RepID=A0A2G5K0P6_9RHOB|nr:hypothetical protein [Amylibacter kogurei]PIB23107.1 hypothetical protein BFP76_08765 [Amylibacter kogurei]